MLLPDVAAITRWVVGFWLMPWSEPFRARSPWFSLDSQPVQVHRRYHSNADAPSFIRPFLLQRWVAQTIAARQQWLKAHPQERPYRYGKESRPCWDAVAWKRYDWRILREFDDAMLLWIFGMEVERLLRIVESDPHVPGTGFWTCAVLGASEHLVQLYRELQRRHTLLPARALLREALRRFVEWQPSEADPGEPGD